MKLHSSIPFALLLALAMTQSAAGDDQKAKPAAVEPVSAAQSATSQPTQLAPGELYRSCNQLILQAQEKAKIVKDSTNPHNLNADRTIQTHKELQQTLLKLKDEHQRFVQALTPEQQTSVQMRNAVIDQVHNRILELAKEMDRELSDNTLHVAEVANQARATQKEMNSYQKEFRAMGGTLGLN